MKNLFKSVAFIAILFVLFSCSEDPDPQPKHVDTPKLNGTTWTRFDSFYSQNGWKIYSVLQFDNQGSVFVSYRINKTELLEQIGTFNWTWDPVREELLISARTGWADTYTQKARIMNEREMYFGGQIYTREP